MSMDCLVPFSDLVEQNSRITAELYSSVGEVLKTGSYIRGREVNEFEREFAELNGSKFCVSCANGTDALYIILKCLDLPIGSEVLVPAHTWISSAASITQAGLTPIFVDIEPTTFTICMKDIASKLTEKTKAVMAVHLYGHPAQIPEIAAFCERFELALIEDCAQAHLARYKSVKVGNFGVAGAFSFYPGKNLGAMGDAGAIVTNDEDFAKKMAAFARHGGLVKGEHRFEGINSRMDTIQAAILRVKMRYLKEWTDIRRAVASAYTKGIVGSEDFKLPTERDGYYHVWHLFTVRVEDRQGFAEYLDKNNITFAINYPVSLPFLPAYERLNSRATDFPEAYSHQNQLLCLPLFSEMSANQVDRVINVIADYLTKNSRD